MFRFSTSALLLAALLLAPAASLARPQPDVQAGVNQHRQDLAAESAQQKQIDAQIKVVSKQIHDEMAAERHAQGAQRTALHAQVTQHSADLAQLKSRRDAIWVAERADRTGMNPDASRAGHDANAHTR